MKFYAKLSWKNLIKYRQIYLPFILTVSFMMVVALVMINICFLGKDLFSEDIANSMRTLFFLGSAVMMMMTLIFASYSNNFTLSQQSQQIGLYEVIGFSKKEISKILFFQNFFCLLITIFTSISIGLGFSRLGYLILSRMLDLPVISGFSLHFEAFIINCFVLTVIFLFLFLLDLLWIWRNDPIEMLHEANVEEKEPKTRWLMLIIGLICLIAGYYLALNIEDPLGAFNHFFIIVLLVVLGTYFLFIAGSIFVLKILRQHKNYYYQPRHFIGLNNMLSRMKQNGTGLASITILVTMTLITIVTTITLFFEIDQIVLKENPVDLQYEVPLNGKDPIDDVRKSAHKLGVKIVKDQILEVVPAYQINLDHDEVKSFNVNDYSIKSAMHRRFFDLTVMTLDNFNQINDTHVQLKSNEVIVYKPNGYAYSKINISGQSYQVKKKTARFLDFPSRISLDSMYLIFSNKDELTKVIGKLEHKNPNVIKFKKHHLITLKGSKKKQLELMNYFPKEVYAQSQVLAYKAVKTILSGFLFMGILIGGSFVIATFLILYYKQLSEGYADAKRYQTLERVGLSRFEIQKIINSQLLLLFYIPLAVATLHCLFALPLIQKTLDLVGASNFKIFLLVGAVVLMAFVFIYIIMYKLTSNVYFKIITQHQMRRE